MTDELFSQVTALVSAVLERKGEETQFVDIDEPLVSGGRLSSLDVVEFVVLIEDHFGIEFAEEELDLTRLDTVRRVTETVLAKLPVSQSSSPS